MFGKVKYPCESTNYKYLRMIITKVTSFKHFVVEKSNTIRYLLLGTDNDKLIFPLGIVLNEF